MSRGTVIRSFFQLFSAREGPRLGWSFDRRNAPHTVRRRVFRRAIMLPLNDTIVSIPDRFVGPR